MNRVVVTGIGALTPIGNNIEEYLEGLKTGRSGSAPITLVDSTHLKTKFACEVKNFDAFEVFGRREANRMDRFCQLALAAVDEAISHSGLDFEKVNKDRCGVIWGSGIGGMTTLEKEYAEYVRGGEEVPRFSPFMIPKLIIDISAGLISMKYDLRGINYSTVSACASSSHSLINSMDYIRMGRADVVVTGGSEASVNVLSVGGFNNMKALSLRNDDPARASRPFDKTRDGFVLGEGAGALVLESYDHAVARGATILAELAGGAMTADAHHMTAPHPEGRGAAKVMELAIEDAKMKTSDIDYINVHGTSTPLGDIAEIKAIQQVFGDDAYDLNISSTKSMTGHLLGGAGAIEAIAGILAIQHSFIPPTINHSTPDPEIDPKLNLTLNHAQESNCNVVMSNTFGFGGHNTSVIMKKI